MKQTSKIKLKVAATKALVMISGIIGIWLLVVAISLTINWLDSLGFVM